MTTSREFTFGHRSQGCCGQCLQTERNKLCEKNEIRNNPKQKDAKSGRVCEKGGENESPVPNKNSTRLGENNADGIVRLRDVPDK